MGMTTTILAIRPPDEMWKRMKEVWDACDLVGVSPPKEVIDFFEGDKPDGAGVVINLRDHPSVSVWHEAYVRSTYEVDLAKLPKDVTFLRFYNRY